MLDIKHIRENPSFYDQEMAKRGIGPISQKILMLDQQRRELTSIIQQLQQERNDHAKFMGQIKDKSSNEFLQAKEKAQEIKTKLAALDNPNNDHELEDFLARLPNILSPDLPIGPDEHYNQEIRRLGNINQFDFKPKEHFDLGEDLAMMDFEDTAKISGARFVTLKATLAKLERALANFALDIFTEEFNYTEISPPLLVREQAMFGVGQLPKFAEDSFVTVDGYRLIPTAEVPLTNLVYDKIIAEDELPLRFTAFTPCFRSEAGSAGRDTRGMIRLHQFSKVELVSIVKPEASAEEHEKLTKIAETTLQRLELPYRVMLLSTGDTGFSAYKTYDLEVWLPGQNKFREIASCSNFIDFQSRRIKARYKTKNNENKLVHTLNGTGLAIGRAIVAILENYQNFDGSITIPEQLRPYMNNMQVIK